ncbi:MAG: ParM/StbA family protein [Chloroflexota bacterium]|nr:ParM/StbA family protein [Chloroflexota bacterium]
MTETYILPQAIGSLYALVLNRHGRLVDSDLARARVGIVDVGMYTTNYVLVDRLRYVEVGSDSVTIGMAEMLEKVGKDLKREYGLDWSLYRGRVDQAVRERSVGVYGEQEDITHIVEPHLEALADTIVSKARSLSGWGAGVDLRAVVLTGGGSGELVPYIRRAYPHTQMVSGDPQLANTAGYLRVGLRRFV